MTRNVIVLALVSAGLSGCARNNVPADALDQITVGMDRSDVERLLVGATTIPDEPDHMAAGEVPAGAVWVRWSDPWSWERREVDVAFIRDRVACRHIRTEEPNSNITNAVVYGLSVALAGVMLTIKTMSRRLENRLAAARSRQLAELLKTVDIEIESARPGFRRR
jgi:hypothetical protein